MLCRMLLNNLPQETATAYLPNPQLTPEGLFGAVGDELGVELPEDSNIHRVLSALQQHLLELATEGRTVVLVIDEAQAMPIKTLETLRLLTNLETESRKLIQVVLFGQPELDAMLGQEALRQLKQRITFHCRLRTLDRRSVEDYLQHRLHQAGFNGGRLFQPGAIRLIARASEGTPRLINILAHKSMIAAYGQGQREVTRRHVKQAVRDTDSVRPLSWLGRWA